MSITTDPVANSAQLCWDYALALYTTQRREELGLSIAAAAGLSGLQISEWRGLEDGWVPADFAILRAVAGVLQARWPDYRALALLSASSQRCGHSPQY